jgi:hypothetical protein
MFAFRDFVSSNGDLMSLNHDFESLSGDLMFAFRDFVSLNGYLMTLNHDFESLNSDLMFAFRDFVSLNSNLISSNSHLMFAFGKRNKIQIVRKFRRYFFADRAPPLVFIKQNLPV